MKKVFSLAVVLGLALLTACGSPAASGAGSPGGASESISFRSGSDIEAALTNYKITVQYSESGSVPVTLTEERCDKGYLWAMDASILFVPYGTGRQYILNSDTKTGTATSLDDEDQYRTFNGTLSSYLFFYDAYDGADMQKVGTELIDGRPTTEYTFNWTDQYDYTFWVDNDTGVTMKYTMTAVDQSVSMEVTDFSTGGVSLSDMINLGDYQITDFGN